MTEQTPNPEQTPEPQTQTPSETPEPAQWQPEKRRFGGIAILTATAAGVLLSLYA